jgi:chromosome partitioning protein
MPVLTITSRKGGCGKTMLSMVVASSLANRNIDVALLDADPNGAAHRWATETHTGQTIKSYLFTHYPQPAGHDTDREHLH